MSKESFYFSHDYNARNDPRLMRVVMKHGMLGLGSYWCIIEMLYEQNGYIPLINIESIAFELHTECERIKSVLQDFDLFKFKNECFYSDSVLRRLKERNAKSEGARESALKRWHPDRYKDANVMRAQSKGNARKGKERKGKERKYYNIPPAIEEIKLRVEERQLKNVNTETFFAHYEANGWLVGKNKMKNWDSALTYWENNKNFKNETLDGNSERGVKRINDHWNRPV